MTTRIALLYPELLGTYGDGGNAEVLAARLRWRGRSAEIVAVSPGDDVPADCHLYLLGGGEDEPQVLAAQGLREGGVLTRAVADGAVVLAVCAGLQIAGQTFWGTDGEQHDGLGLLDLETRRTFGAAGEPLPPRAVGDIAVDPDPALGLPILTGYENHGGRSRPVAGARGSRLGTARGNAIGNGTPDRAEGWVAGRVFATYLHGPLLAQNPAVADLLLRWVHPDLEPLEDPPQIAELRRSRLASLGV